MVNRDRAVASLKSWRWIIAVGGSYQSGKWALKFQREYCHYLSYSNLTLQLSKFQIGVTTYIATSGKITVNLSSTRRARQMLVVMKAHATEEQVRAVCEKIESLGYRAHPIPGAQRTAIGITGNKGALEPGALEEMSGVQELIQVSKPYKLVSRDVKEE